MLDVKHLPLSTVCKTRSSSADEIANVNFLVRGSGDVLEVGTPVYQIQ